MTAARSGKRALAAAVFAPAVLGLSLTGASAALAAPSAEPPAPDEQAAVEIPGIEEFELADLPEPGFETVATWSADNEPVTDLTTDEGPIHGGQDADDDEDEGEDSEDEEKDDSDDKGDSDDDSDGTEDGDEDSDDEGTAPESGECEAVTDDATADRLVFVDGGGDGDSKATVTTCEKTGDGYTEVASYEGFVGTGGISAEGQKKEGDGTTPAGTFSLDEGFGHKDKPAGFAGDWTKIADGDVWVDDPSSDRYNEYVPAAEADGYSGEDLASEVPAYNYAWVVDYNRDPAVPGAGSAIFLHVNTGSGATAGCVSLPEDDLLDVIEWAGDEDAEIQIKR